MIGKSGFVLLPPGERSIVLGSIAFGHFDGPQELENGVVPI